jgi:valyl-tRNA synthetase
MKQEFPKKYDVAIEKEIYHMREKEGVFAPEYAANHAAKARKGAAKKFVDTPRYMMTLPPPNVTGVLHTGHGLMLSIEDAIIRYHRMQGKETLWLPATDHAGIATQVKVEDKLRAEGGRTREQLGREAFVREVWDWAKKSRNTIISQTKAMGSSMDWGREEFTLSEKLSRAVRKAFVMLYNQGKISQGTRIVNRSVGTQSVISDIEIVYKEVEGRFYHLKYFLEGKGESITVATTRPETIFADVAIAVSPHDKRYKKMIGKKVLIPIINRAIPIIADEAVDMTFGTGALKVTPAHDLTDFEIGKRNNLPLDVFAIDKAGNFTAQAGIYAGRKVDDAFEGFVQELGEINNLEKMEPHTHTVPFCERSGTRIQPMVSQQWFFDVAEPAAKALSMINGGEVAVHPERFVHEFNHRLGNIQPRCISRQLWWGHRIPVWKSLSGTAYVFDEDTIWEFAQEHKKDKKQTILSMMIFNLIADSRLEPTFSLEKLIDVLTSDSIVERVGRVIDAFGEVYRIKFAADTAMMKELEELLCMFATADASFEKFVDMLENTYLITQDRDQYAYQIDALANAGDVGLTQDTDVLDTWFSSGLWPFSTLGWPEQTPDLAKYYPNDMLETGADIIFFWVARMMIMGIALTDQMPFTNVFFHGLVRDEKGRKMSKSLGNIVDPLSVIEKYGADALRCGLMI